LQAVINQGGLVLMLASGLSAHPKDPKVLTGSTSSTSSGKSGHSCLVLELTVKSIKCIYHKGVYINIYIYIYIYFKVTL
jgi:hypothetical protein